MACSISFSATPAHAAPARFAELVADAQTGRIIHGENINSLRHPASLTKVMTLYLTFAALEQGRLQLDGYLPVSWKAASQQPSRLGLDEGGRLKVRDAIYGLVTESTNDASVVLAEGIGGSEERFAHLMTQQARTLGMKRTTYRNANGLHDPEMVTTAFDQAILARAMLFHFPQYYKYFRTRSFTYDGVAHRNHNRLMTRYEGMDGIKTGYVRASGFNLMASAKRNNTRLIGIVFGGRSAVTRDNRMADILDSSFERVHAEVHATRKYGAAAVTPTSTSVNDVSRRAEAAIPADTLAQGDAALPEHAVSDAPRARKVAARSASKAKTPTRANWAVQVGSFPDRKKGLSAIRVAKSKAPSHLKNASMKLVEAKNGRKTIYRARLTGLDERSARNACNSLTNMGRTCLTVPPRG